MIQLNREELTEIFVECAKWSEKHGHDIILDIEFQRVISKILELTEDK